MSRFILLFLLAIFTASIIWGSVSGDFFGESGAIIEMPWGVVMLLDLYIGFFLFSIFIYMIEGQWARTLAWTIGLMLGGNAVALVYLLIKFDKIKNIFAEAKA